jgi:hypothetical protein
MVPPLARGARGFPLPSRITTVGTPLSCRARVPILWNTPSDVERVQYPDLGEWFQLEYPIARGARSFLKNKETQRMGIPPHTRGA